ncbi:MAG: hypothetical protein SchgKO_05870 [Schleiferiaceae bacterium]
MVKLKIPQNLLIDIRLEFDISNKIEAEIKEWKSIFASIMRLQTVGVVCDELEFSLQVNGSPLKGRNGMD